jgi:hypothetical protein
MATTKSRMSVSLASKGASDALINDLANNATPTTTPARRKRSQLVKPYVQKGPTQQSLCNAFLVRPKIALSAQEIQIVCVAWIASGS